MPSLHDRHVYIDTGYDRQEHDFYENLFMSEKIVDGHVKLALPTVESSEDEEEAWSKWEAANHRRYQREKELARRSGRSPSGSSSKSPSMSGILRQKKRPESPVGRRGPRARNDPSYAALLDRRDQNTRKVWEAKMKAGDDDAETTRGRSPGRLEKSKTKTPPSKAFDSSDDENYPSAGGSGSGSRGRGRRAGGIVREALAAQLAESRQHLASPSTGEKYSPTDLAPRLAGAAPAPSPRARRPSSAPRSASSHGRELVVPRAAYSRDYSQSPGRRSSDGTCVPEDDEIAFGRHATFEGRAARERRREALGIPKPSRRPSNATTTFDPPRLHTASRNREREENRLLTEEAWRRRAMVEYVVRTVVGDGADGERRATHWDDPMLAAAEQAAHNVREATGDEDAARAAARRAAAAAAALVNAAGGGHSPTTHGTNGTTRRHTTTTATPRLALPPPADDGSDHGSDGSEYGDFERELAVAGGRRGALAVGAERKPVNPESRRNSRRNSARPSSAGRFLRSGKGGAGMSRGRSVAAMEEEVDPAHAARLRESLENANGIAQARSLAEKAEKEARAGMARVAARHRAAENAERSRRSSPVRSAVKQALGARLAESRRYVAARARTPARSRLEDRPDFDLNFTTRRAEETPGREAFSPIAVRYPDGTPGSRASFNVADEAAAARARARELALEAAAAAEAAEAANRRLAAAEMSSDVRVRGERVPVFDPRTRYRGGSPGGGGSAGKRHGLSLVRESLGSFL